MPVNKHRPLFGYDVYFVKFIATGTGCRKQEAKEATADRALRTIYGDSGNNQPTWQVLTSYVNPDPKDSYDDYDVKTNLQNATDKVSTALTKIVRVNPFEDPTASSISACEISSNGQSNAISTVLEGTNPISTFMEYAQAIGEVGRIEEETKCGPSHRPTFTVCAYIGTKKLAKGTGGNKKLAKRQAAEESLKMLSFSSSRALISPMVSPTPSRPVIDKNAGICPVGADPISVLNDFAQKRGLELTFPNPEVTGADHQREFTLSAMVGSTIYPRATASTIQEAKREASRNALRHLKQNKHYQFTSGLHVSKLSIIESLTFHDKMAKLCHEKFDSVVADIFANLAGGKVVAGIVMENKTTKTFEVISLASGNRFIKGSELTTDGQVLIDSHAEILVNRGMRRFLFYHLKKLCRGDETNVLLQRCGEGKAEFAPDIQFHLYISTAPCGDGAIFTHSAGTSETEQVEQHHPTFDDAKQGLLRTKVEQGEGQIPSKEVHESYKGLDTIRRGERLRVMSCSDKICKWNLLGMQGALLANLIKPVYFTSITLGTLYNHGHMARAMCCRLEKHCQIAYLPDGYKVNHPLLGAVSRKEIPQRSVEKSTALCINWNVSDDHPEMTDGTTGFTHSSGCGRAMVKSRLCKLELLRSYKDICTNAGLLHLVKDDYLLTKNASKQYQRCKKTLYAIFNSQAYGAWIGLPRECQGFSTSTSPTAPPLQWPQRNRNTMTAQTILHSLFKFK
ncbi:double-stranded RNA-specific adenosine deaminase-like [Mizuhopecten yessoensis]|uniref:double-stranded RNA-specific adenosine deaminase-like n=1 Tax=Mizuhopecten yessoensis TaxID=6573 RepID=UPI000B45EEB5|nr:double-stranded RNA-specific adenosine deaminase-like [Mizuhopecten yessoensis]